MARQPYITRRKTSSPAESALWRRMELYGHGFTGVDWSYENNSGDRICRFNACVRSSPVRRRNGLNRRIIRIGSQEQKRYYRHRRGALRRSKQKKKDGTPRVGCVPSFFFIKDLSSWICRRVLPCWHVLHAPHAPSVQSARQ